MACFCVCWPITGVLDHSTVRKIKNVFVFDQGDNCLYLTHQGDLYAFGKNGERAPLGCDTCDFICKPKKITEIGDEREPIL